jgi:hypothetical protein
MSRHLGVRRGGNVRLNRSAAGLGLLPRRRIGRATFFDVHNNVTGNVMVRNTTAQEVVATYCPSLPDAEAVIAGVAERHHIDADNMRITAHMAIGT